MDKNILIKSIIGKIATGPDLSKNLSFIETKEAMDLILTNKVSDVQKAVFLIALRMKRETQEENQGVLGSIIANSTYKKARVKNLIDIGDPYSGYERSVPISSFLPPLLAELGLPTVIHSVEKIAPKYGLTHFHINKAMGLDPNISAENAMLKIENKNIGWSYIDQKNFCLNLHNLIPLRNEIIKRSVLNTVETLIHPIKGESTHSILGFVHKPYPPIYAKLANFSGFATALLVRGVEGGVVPSLRQQGLVIGYKGDKEKLRLDVQPQLLGIKQNVRSIVMIEGSIMDQAKYTVKLGLDALSGKQGIFYDGLVLSASLILWHINKLKSLTLAGEMVRSVLESGKSLQRIK